MARRAKLTPASKAKILRIVDQVAEKTAQPSITAISREAVRKVAKQQGKPVTWANAAILALAEDGMHRLVQAHLKKDRAKIWISRTGQVLSIPTRLGIKVVKKKKEDPEMWQQPLWWELSWDRFQEVVKMLSEQGKRLAHEAEALHEVLRLRDRYPESKTVLDALEMAGIDPRKIRIEEVA